MSKMKIQTFTSSPKASLVIALIILAIFLPPLINGYLSTSWPTVQGKVLTSKTKSHDKALEIIVEYEYEADGTLLTGKNFSYNRQVRVGSSKKIYSRLDDYKKGSLINVHYLPSKPSKSTLVPGYSILDLVISSIGSIFLIGGISIYLKTGSLNKGLNTMDESSQKKIRQMFK